MPRETPAAELRRSEPLCNVAKIMPELDFDEVVSLICKEDLRFDRKAYARAAECTVAPGSAG